MGDRIAITAALVPGTTDPPRRKALVLGILALNLKYTGPEGERLGREGENMPMSEREAWIRSHLVPFEGR